jgi:hypothetical protein
MKYLELGGTGSQTGLLQRRFSQERLSGSVPRRILCHLKPLWRIGRLPAETRGFRAAPESDASGSWFPRAGWQASPFNDLPEQDVQKLFDEIDRKKALKHKTLQRIKTAVSAVFTYAMQQNLVSRNPVQGTQVEGD